MFYEERTTVPDTPETLREDYETDLAEIVTTVGLDDAVAATGIDRAHLEALGSGETPLSLAEAAQIAALAEETPDPETIVEIACEHLLLGMSMAVLDVEALEGELEIDLDAKEIQQKIERRASMTFAEFVHIQHAIVGGIPSR